MEYRPSQLGHILGSPTCSPNKYMANNLMIWLDAYVFACCKHGKLSLLFDGLSLHPALHLQGQTYTFYSGSHAIVPRCFFTRTPGVCSVYKDLTGHTMTCGPERMAVLIPGGWEISLNSGNTVLLWKCVCCLLNSLPYLFVAYVSFASLILNFVVILVLNLFFSVNCINDSSQEMWINGQPN